MSDVNSFVLDFGKYRGSALVDIAEHNPSYITYIANISDANPKASVSNAIAACQELLKAPTGALKDYVDDMAEEEKARLEADAVAAKVVQHSAFQGELGERFTKEVKILGNFNFQGRSFSYYDSGIRWVISMADKKGNLYTAFISSEDLSDSLKVGEVFNISMTVSKHEVVGKGKFKDADGTIVKRLKVCENDA